MIEIKWNKEQQEVLDSQGNTLVSASAGSGKTTVMIEKIFRLLREGADLSRILVMTFSRSSAQDMKNKLVKKIYDHLTPDKEGEKLRSRLEQIPFSGIGTINSFCYSLMKKYFTVVGCDPSSVMLDENEQKVMLDESLDKAIEREIESGREDFLKVISFFSQGRKQDLFKKIILSLRNFLAVQDDPNKYVSVSESDNSAVLIDFSKKYYGQKIRELEEMSNHVSEWMWEEGYTSADKDLAENRVTLELAEKEEDLENKLGELKKLVRPRNIASTAVDKGKVSAELRDYFSVVVDKIASVREEAERTAIAYEKFKQGDGQEKMIFSVLIRVYLESEEEYRNKKKSRCAVDFNDAERATLIILSDEKCREEIRKTYDYVFIDEYQDTNYLQEAILAGVSGENNLFAVGDVKQAIYRFRFAEPKIFNDRKKRYEGEHIGKNCFLNGNYRSCKEILTFTNMVCSEIMTESFGAVDYRHQACLVAGGSEEGDENSVCVYTYEQEPQTLNAEKGEIYRVKTAPKKDITDAEGQFIAEEIKRLYGQKIVSEKGEKKEATYGDFCILVRKSAWIMSVAKVLSENRIPYFVAREDKSVLPEREILADVLRVLSNEETDIPFYHVLSSPLFSFSPEELYRIGKDREQKSFAQAFREYQGEYAEKRDAVLKKIEEWRFLSTYLSIADLLKAVMSEGFDAYLLSCGREIITQINAFILFVEKQCAGMSLYDFLYYYDNIYQGNLPPAPKDAVAIMTMHSSKGLEFPVVFIPYASKEMYGRGDGKNLLFDRELGMAIMHFDEEGHLKERSFATDMMEKKANLEEAEGELRLMYVAFTRAKDRLIIIGEKKEKTCEPVKARCLMDWLNYAERCNGTFGKKYFRPLPVYEKSVDVCPPTHPKSFNFSLLEREYLYQADTETFAKTTVTRLLEASTPEKVGEEGERIWSKEEEENREVGNAVHAFLKLVDFTADSTQKAEWEKKRLIAEHLLSEEEGERIDCEKVARFLSAPVMEKARTGKAYREQPFIAYLTPQDGAKDKILVQGIIDLMVELPDGTVLLVDYKMSGLGAEKLKERYRKQLETYKSAIENILKKRVSEMGLYNILRGYYARF